MVDQPAPGPLLLLDDRSRERICQVLASRHDVRWRPAGIETSFWRRLTHGQVRTVPLTTWRLLVAWFGPPLSRTIGPPI
jgi:hypothetical protein